MSTVQVVVDVQEGYLNNDYYHRLTRRCITEEVRRLAREGMPPVLVLEMFEWKMPAYGAFDEAYLAEDGQYWHPGRTIREIRAVIDEHPGMFVVKQKRTKNGAAKVLEHCSELGLSPHSFRLCGGFVDGCLYATALALLCDVPGSEVEITGSATFCNSPSTWTDLFNLRTAPGKLLLRSTEEAVRVIRHATDPAMGFVTIEKLARMTVELRQLNSLTIT